MVNTFMPYPDYKEVAKVLDWRRLGNQRLEAMQILGALTGESVGWVNHPAAKMWRYHEGALCLYAIRMCEEWKRRGYTDNMLPFFTEKIAPFDYCEQPWWMGLDRFHISHQSNLLRKDPSHYRQYFGDVPDDLPYYWPEPENMFYDPAA